MKSLLKNRLFRSALVPGFALKAGVSTYAQTTDTPMALDKKTMNLVVADHCQTMSAQHEKRAAETMAEDAALTAQVAAMNNTAGKTESGSPRSHRYLPSVMKTLSLVCLVMIAMGSGVATEPDKLLALKPELPKTGVNLARDDGGWINVVVVERRFVVSFFNDLKMPVAADVHHGLVRYKYVAKTRDRTVLTRSADGKTLDSPHSVGAPFVFRVHLALFNDGPDDLTETYAFSYSQD